jgi:hypothetical protein
VKKNLRSKNFFKDHEALWAACAYGLAVTLVGFGIRLSFRFGDHGDYRWKYVLDAFRVLGLVLGFITVYLDWERVKPKSKLLGILSVSQLLPLSLWILAIKAKYVALPENGNLRIGVLPLLYLVVSMLAFYFVGSKIFQIEKTGGGFHAPGSTALAIILSFTVLISTLVWLT